MSKPAVVSESDYHYYCFPILGITCDDAKDPTIFLFEDSTLLKGHQVRSLFDKLFGKNDTRNFRVVFNEEVQFLVLRLVPGEGEDMGKMTVRAKRRVREVIGGIAVPLLAYSCCKTMPCLEAELYSASGSSLLHFGALGGGIRNESSQSIPIGISELHFTRDRLHDILHRKPFEWLTTEVLGEVLEKDGSYQQLIRTAISNFYLSVNHTTATTQFLGCYSSLDVLLSYSQSKHELLFRRMSVLVGDSVFQQYCTVDPLPGTEGKKNRIQLDKLRHDIVHAGGSSSEPAAHSLMLLSIAVLTSVAKHNRRFLNQEELCMTLDLLSWLRRTRRTKDPLGIGKQWDKDWATDCVWQWQPARLVEIFGLHKDVDVIDDFHSNTACALFTLRKWTGWADEIVFDQLKNAMYYRDMPFQSSLEAWDYVQRHELVIKEKADPLLQWFGGGSQ